MDDLDGKFPKVVNVEVVYVHNGSCPGGICLEVKNRCGTNTMWKIWIASWSTDLVDRYAIGNIQSQLQVTCFQV